MKYPYYVLFRVGDRRLPGGKIQITTSGTVLTRDEAQERGLYDGYQKDGARLSDPDYYLDGFKTRRAAEQAIKDAKEA